MKGRRTAPRLVPGERLLIVTEDTRSANVYLDTVRADARLPESRAVIRPGGGSAPVSVVETAVEIARSREGPFDRVYVVLDEDAHPTLDAALSRLRDLNREREARGARDEDGGPLYEAIVSSPCFEYFLLLHFRYTRAPFAAGAGGSPADEAVRQLRAHLPGYAKSERRARRLWADTGALLDTARAHAVRSTREAERDERRNPSTTLDVVVDVLRHLGDGGTLADFDRRGAPDPPRYGLR